MPDWLTRRLKQDHFWGGDTIPRPLAEWRSQAQQPTQLNLSFILHSDNVSFISEIIIKDFTLALFEQTTRAL